MGGAAACDALNAKYGGLVKPDIVFFGEKLPDRFYQLAGIPAFPGMTCDVNDFDKCDLLIVMGTSLLAQVLNLLSVLVQSTKTDAGDCHCAAVRLTH